MESVKLNKFQLIKLGLTIEQAEEIIANGVKNDWQEEIANLKDYVNVLEIKTKKIKLLDKPTALTFKNESEVDKIIQKLELFAKMENFALVRNEGWVADWKSGEKKYGIVQEHENFVINHNVPFNVFVFNISVKSQEIAEEMYNLFSKELKSVFFADKISQKQQVKPKKEILEFSTKIGGLTKTEFVLQNLDKYTIKEFEELGIKPAHVYQIKYLHNKQKSNINEIQVKDAFVFENADNSVKNVEKKSILSRFLNI